MESSESGGFCVARRIGYDRTLSIDEYPQRHVALNLLAVQRRRIPKRQLFVEHHWRDIRLPADRLKRQVGPIPLLAGRRHYQQSGNEALTHAVRVQPAPPSRLTSPTSRDTSSSA